ncbi:hypothetical protein DVH24_032812 [Malus domestica]|uniref:Uncharacterized protein n=1 Tax=Malus domestica TaxID=3750 RepID=A0A498ILV7_MALDO|nr:hypothetical protein DVH24_032812 [Malus domestica]
MSQASSSPRSSAHLDALTQEIEKKLQRALASPSQRRNLLQELFADIALEIDERAKEMILSREEDAISPAEDGIEGQLCFYDVLTDHYVRVPENGKRILDLIVQLWSQSFASHIFALLFHKWLFEVQLDNSEVLLRYSSALVEGATNVFWIDTQSNARRFQSLFCYLLEDVALEPKRLNKIPVQVQRDLFLLLSRFIIFYNSGGFSGNASSAFQLRNCNLSSNVLIHAVDKLDSFLREFPHFPNAFLIGSSADFFVIELADQLQKLKVEPVLLHYLSYIKVLQGMELRMATSTRLKACLYSFTSPGGPMYPTRAVRHAAWDALDLLFPVSWQIPAASHKPVLPIAISMVLARFLLEFRHGLRKGGIVFSVRINLLKFGEAEKAKVLKCCQFRKIGLSTGGCIWPNFWHRLGVMNGTRLIYGYQVH